MLSNSILLLIIFLLYTQSTRFLGLPPTRSTTSKKLNHSAFVQGVLTVKSSSTSSSLLSMNRQIKTTKASYTSKGLSYEADGVTIKDSLFQNIADGLISPEPPKKGTPERSASRQLLHQDEKVAAFYTMAPGCDEGHILVVPRDRPINSANFLKTCKDLGPADLDLLQHMKSVGTKVMKEHQKLHNIPEEEFGYYFHVPPFNSINHLHLHVLGSHLKRSSIKDYVKYPTNGIETPWCIQLETLIASIRASSKQAHFK